MAARAFYECPGCGLAIMDRMNLPSSNLVSVGYEAEEGEGAGLLEVEFKRGVVYQYQDVPESLYRQLLYAPSPGRFLMQYIVGTYEGVRIE